MNLIPLLQSVIKEVSTGNWNARIDQTGSDPELQKTAEEINKLLDAVQARISKEESEFSKQRDETEKGLKQVSHSLEKLAAGDTGIVLKVSDTGSEELIRVSKNLEILRNSVNIALEDVMILAEAGKSGNYSIKIDSSNHRGEFKVAVEQVNAALEYVKNPVKEVLRVSQEYVNSNFNACFDSSIKAVGDWEEVKGALDNVGTRVSDIIKQINSYTHELSLNSKDARESVTDVVAGAEKVARNSAVVSENAERGDQGARQILQAMEDLSVTVGEVSQKTESVSMLVQESTDLSKNGTELARQAEAGMGVITESANAMDQNITEIQGEMEKIGKIVDLITDIANQTNLLALNAAIEAARAGDAGRGFAVVASEVKALAEESRHSAENIIEMIGSLQKRSEMASDAVYSANEAVKAGNVALSDTLGVFGKLAESVEEISDNIEMVASMSEEQAAAVEEITSSVHEVSNMIKDTAKQAADSATATDETAASIDQLTVIVDQVGNIAEQVNSEMEKFRL